MSLDVGSETPRFALPSHNSGEVSLDDYRGKNVMLAFFPLAWTPV